MLVTKLAFSILHVLAGAAWFGAMFYSLTVLHPRAALFFKDNERFEAFIAAVSDGARWKVLSACGLIAVSGLGLAAFQWPSPVSALWLVLMSLKLALFLAAVTLFIYTSWRLWPARVFAAPEDIPSFQRKFKLIAQSLLILVGLNLALGVAAHIL